MADAETIRVELIRVARLRPDPGSQAVRPGIVIERRTDTFSRKPGETVGEAIGRAEAHIGRGIEAAASQYAAQAIGDPLWKTVSERWAADGSAGIDAAAGTVTDFDAYVHNLLLGRPVRQISFELGLPGPIPAVLGGVAGAVELPADRPLDTVARVIQVGGIVVGVMSGHPVLVSACFKSLVHDKFIGALRAGIERTFSTPDASLMRERTATDPAAGRAAVQRAAEREAAARKALVTRAREAAQQRGTGTAVREGRAGTRPREAPQQEAERSEQQNGRHSSPQNAPRPLGAAARVLHGPSDPPGRQGPTAGPGISPFR